MHIIKVQEKTNSSGEPTKYGRKMAINAGNLVGVSTNSLYIRKGFLNGTLFLSQKGNGVGGSGDICKLFGDNSIEVNSKLYERIRLYAEKAKAIING
jgi:hypothetical protein